MTADSAPYWRAMDPARVDLLKSSPRLRIPQADHAHRKKTTRLLVFCSPHGSDRYSYCARCTQSNIAQPVLREDRRSRKSDSLLASFACHARGHGTGSKTGESEGRQQAHRGGLPVHNLRALRDDLATLTYNVCYTPLNPQAKIIVTTRSTPLQDQALHLLSISQSS